jgi:formate dehydrogenase major subunit
MNLESSKNTGCVISRSPEFLTTATIQEENYRAVESSADNLRVDLKVVVNGILQVCAPGQTLLSVIQRAGIELPALCHDPRIKPSGSCRLCLVEVDGSSHAVAACTTPALDGMSVRTHTPALEDGRRTVLAMLAEHYPESAVREWPEKQFHRWLRQYEVTARPGDTSKGDGSHPYIQVDMSRCIDCYRCVRICAELQGQFVWNIWNRGEETRVVADDDVPLGASSCVSCGACVDTCPTGALEDKQVLQRKPPVSWTRTTCPYCGTGCEMLVGAARERLVSVRPVMDAPVSQGHLCVKGRYAFDFVHAGDRVTSPMIRRRGGDWQNVSWRDAIDHVGDQLSRVRDVHGPDAIGLLGSARATNEENYIAQKFARVVLHTNNVDCCARVCHAPTAAAMGAMLGAGAATNSFDDIEDAKTILIFGANPTENHPIVGARIKQAAIRGTRLIVVDPRRTELAAYATIHLAIRPGTNVALLNAMAYVVVEEGLVDAEFIATRVKEWEEFCAFIRAWPPERAAEICGIDASLIREAARLYATGKPSMSIHGLGLTEHVQGTEGVMCLVNLALLTGNIGKPGSGVNPLRGQNNVQGSAHMGCEPDHLTGYAALDAGRKLFERVWGAPLPGSRGKNLLAMMDAAEQGELRAMWVMGYDISLTNANHASTRRGLSRLETVIVQDLFLNETAREFGTVFLPACSSFEKDGTFMNAERRVQRVRKAIEPVGESRPDWEPLCAAARAMGHPDGFSFSSAEEIWNEIRQLWSDGAGITYDRLEHGGLQWPCPEESHPGTRILHVTRFGGQPAAALRRVEWQASVESVGSDQFPLILITGRLLYQFNAGTMTMRTANVYWRPTDTIDLSEEDARDLAVSTGERVRIVSRHGSAELPARVVSGLRPGEAFATFHSPEAFLNNVTGTGRDSITATPEYKVTAIRIEKLSADRRSSSSQ